MKLIKMKKKEQTEGRIKPWLSDQQPSMLPLCHVNHIEKCKLIVIGNMCKTLTSNFSKAKHHL